MRKSGYMHRSLAFLIMIFCLSSATHSAYADNCDPVQSGSPQGPVEDSQRGLLPIVAHYDANPLKGAASTGLWAQRERYLKYRLEKEEKGETPMEFQEWYASVTPKASSAPTQKPVEFFTSPDQIALATKKAFNDCMDRTERRNPKACMDESNKLFRKLKAQAQNKP